MSPSRNTKPSAIVGVDIGSDLIKVAEAKYSAKDGITITGLGVAKMPEGIVENEVIVNPKALGDAIKALLAESGIKTKKSVSSVSGQSRVVVRVIEVPKMSGKELAETMKWEVERHVPFSANEVVMDFAPLEVSTPDPNAQNMEVLLAVAQEELINRHVEALQAAGLKPVAIDIEPLAASRALVDAIPTFTPSGIYAIINIGSKNTDLSIFENGVLTFPSPPLGIAGTTFTQEIAEAMGQTLEEAELTKKEYAAVHLDAFDSAANPATMSVASEPTSFGTSVGPIDGAFDLGGSGAPADAALADAGAFTNTVDGPVFDVDPLLGDSQPATPAAGPVFDFGVDDSMPKSEPVDAPQTRSMSPVFDLDDDEPNPSMEPEKVEPDFDLSDAKESANPGEYQEYVEEELVHAVPERKDSAITELEEKVFQSISGVLTDLATELRRSLEYYSTKYAKIPLKIYLCGGTAKMPNLDKFLSNELGIFVEVADPVRKLKVKVPSASPPYLKEISPMVSVSIGLAVRDMVD
ncbi:MAG: type IV pilus assembly protein PilM [Armatimonadetes bacterium]|nr:type IV pilus assembly protein PilM [Armatimonadota bacterium]